MSCPSGHGPSTCWLQVSFYGRPVLGISVCSNCGGRATLRDFILWAMQPALPVWEKEDYDL